MLNNKFTPPNIDQATIDYYVAKGRRERSKAFGELIRALFSSPTTKPQPAATPQSGCTA